jgi:hypothetical protein
VSSTSNLARYTCPYCDRAIGVRPDQFGRRLKCPACKRTFTIDRSVDPTGPSVVTSDLEPAADANELEVLASRSSDQPSRQWQKAKITATFPKGSDLTFQAAVQAVRGCQAEILHVDKANHRLQFSFVFAEGRVAEHDLFVFEAVGGASDIDISSRDPNENYQFDPLYQIVIREVSKYLLFAADEPEQQYVQPSPPPSGPTVVVINERRNDDDGYLRMLESRRRSRGGADGLSIAGFVCAVVGCVFFCLPLLGGGLGSIGVVFGGIGIARGKRGKTGFAIASLTVGIVACLLSLIALIVYADDRRHRY